MTELIGGNNFLQQLYIIKKTLGRCYQRNGYLRILVTKEKNSFHIQLLTKMAKLEIFTDLRSDPFPINPFSLGHDRQAFFNIIKIL